MNTQANSRNQFQTTSGKHAFAHAVALMILMPLGVSGGGVVTECIESSLRAAMVGGGTVTFDCDGAITLASTITNKLDVALDGAGHNITISGAGAVRVFYIASNSAFVVKNLKIANGRSSKGAGIFNDGGTLTLTGVSLVANYADSFDESGQVFVATAEGGGLFNRNGVVNALACHFSANIAFKPLDDIPATDRNARGGALRNESGVITLQACRFEDNHAVGAPPMGPTLSPGRDGLGGAIHNSGTLTAVDCSFLGNSARGEPVADMMYPAPAGGAGAGGAIYNLGELVLLASTVCSNKASGGAGGIGSGGCVMTCPGSPSPGGPGSSGGSASGGGLFNAGTASAVNCTFAWNTCVGGAGGPGGNGGPATLPYVRGTDGGNGGTGGSSFGGGVFGVMQLTNCTLAFNAVLPGVAGTGGAGGSAIPPNYAGQPGGAGNSGAMAGGGISGGSFLIGTLLATNQPGGNCHGAISDGGYNLSSDSTGAFTHAGSLNNADPFLGSLASQGGPTLTMALLPGSPAIDAAPSTAPPPTDQRGMLRPFGSTSDIGAYEYATRLRLNHRPENGLDLALHDGVPGAKCRLLTSPDLVNWQSVATNQILSDGTTLFQDILNASQPQLFYRVASP